MRIIKTKNKRKRNETANSVSVTFDCRSAVFTLFTFCLTFKDVASRTYQQNQTVLHRLMLKNYNRDERPVRNQNQILIIQMYPHVTHISIDQSEQTVMLNGIMHMVTVLKMLHF